MLNLNLVPYLDELFIFSKVALVALVSVIVVCGYPIGGPPDALDQVTASLNRSTRASSTFSLA